MCIFNGVGSTTINSGTFTGNEGDDYVIYTNASMTINGGTFKHTGGAIIQNNTNGIEHVMTVNGGTFEGGDGEGEDKIIFEMGKSAKLYVYGGTYNGKALTGRWVSSTAYDDIGPICRKSS